MSTKLATKLKTLFLAFTALLILGVSACERTTVSPTTVEMESQIGAKDNQEGTDPRTPCSGPIERPGTYQIIPSPKAGFDYAVKMTYPSINPGRECICRESDGTIITNIPLDEIAEVVITEDGVPGAIAHHVYRMPRDENFPVSPSPAAFRFNQDLGDLLLIKLISNSPSRGSLGLSVGGICIVDNIPDPNG